MAVCSVIVWFHIWRDVRVWKVHNDASSYRRAKSAEYKSIAKLYENDRDGEISYLVWISLKERSSAHPRIRPPPPKTRKILAAYYTEKYLYSRSVGMSLSPYSSTGIISIDQEFSQFSHAFHNDRNIQKICDVHNLFLSR